LIEARAAGGGMIELTGLATGRTTAATNLLISLVGVIAVVYFHGFRALEP
jgi:hypothetical protein